MEYTPLGCPDTTERVASRRRFRATLVLIFIWGLCTLILYLTSFLKARQQLSSHSMAKTVRSRLLASPMEPSQLPSIAENGLVIPTLNSVQNEMMMRQAYAQFIQQMRKEYSPVEYEKRFLIYWENMRTVASHNSQLDITYTMGPNQMSDWTPAEFQSLLGMMPPDGYLRTSLTNGVKEDESLLLIDASQLPTSVDWRNFSGSAGSRVNCVTPVKNQLACGSCWAFSSTGAVEGAYCIQAGKLVSLSEQQIIDCSFNEGNMGCLGGSMLDAFAYGVHSKGFCAEQDYPYHAVSSQCHDTTCKPIVHLESFYRIPPLNGTILRAALALKGPIAAAMQANEPGIQFYHSGIFHMPCGHKLNHGILIVGYGTENNHETGKNYDYWLVKNSWGSHWGQRGYIKLARHEGHKGECGILMDASYPVVRLAKPDAVVVNKL